MKNFHHYLITFCLDIDSSSKLSESSISSSIAFMSALNPATFLYSIAMYLMFPNWDGNYKTWFGRGEKPLQDGFNYFNAESQNAVELEAPYTPIEPERPSDDYGGGGRHRKKPRRPLDAEDKCDICSEGPIYEKDVNIEDYDDPIQVCQSCFDDTFTDIAAESFDAEDTITVTEIDWETDGEDIDLPTKMKVPAQLL